MSSSSGNRKSNRRRKQGDHKQKPAATAAAPASNRANRKAAARNEAKKKQQLRLLIGGLIAVVAVVGVVVFLNRPSSNGIQIDFTGVEVVQSELVINQGPPVATAVPNQISFATGPTVGDPDAPVTLHIYSDFQCHYCKVFHDETLPLIVNDFVRTGKVKLIFHDFPRLGTDGGIADPNDTSVELADPNNESSIAAQAAVCASEQDAYLEMTDKLFGNYSGVQRGAYSRSNINRFASDLDLDTDAFGTCMDSGRYVPGLGASVDQGVEIGITGTPNFVLDNGSGSLNVFQQTELGYDMIKRQIEISIETAP